MMENENEFIESSNAYVFLGKQDRHLVRLLHWIDIINNLADEVRFSERDNELEEILKAIVLRLEKEVGHRMTMIFPKKGE